MALGRLKLKWSANAEKGAVRVENSAIARGEVKKAGDGGRQESRM